MFGQKKYERIRCESCHWDIIVQTAGFADATANFEELMKRKNANIAICPKCKNKKLLRKNVKYIERLNPIEFIKTWWFYLITKKGK